MSTSNQTRIFTASCVALIVTAMTFAIRAGTLTELSNEFGLTDNQLGWMNSMAFWGFPIATLIGGLIYNLIGAKRMVYIAFFAHLVGLVLWMTAGGLEWLVFSTLVIGFANGTVEAGCNPLIADIYHDNKTTMLNRFHAHHIRHRIDVETHRLGGHRWCLAPRHAGHPRVEANDRVSLRQTREETPKPGQAPLQRGVAPREIVHDDHRWPVADRPIRDLNPVVCRRIPDLGSAGFHPGDPIGRTDSAPEASHGKGASKRFDYPKSHGSDPVGSPRRNNCPAFNTHARRLPHGVLASDQNSPVPDSSATDPNRARKPATPLSWAAKKRRSRNARRPGAQSASQLRCPRQDSNLRTRFRRPVLYPLSYGGGDTPRLKGLPQFPASPLPGRFTR